MGARDKVLELLEKNRGDYISGEAIAQRLEVSRNTVWRAIKDLQDSGYAIKAVTNKGYCLDTDNDILSLAGIVPHLLSGEMAHRIEVHDTVTSTNQLAKEHAVREVIHGQVILADGQDHGRGRYKRSFFSPRGSGIYISFVLDPDQLGFANPQLITIWAAVCVCRVLEEQCGLNPRIKWVNDILLDGKKAGGILTEAISDFESQRVSAVILGIGLNYRTRQEDFPDDLADTATSLYPQGNAAMSRNQFIAALINQISMAEHSREGNLLREYRSRLAVLGRTIQVVEGESTYTAKALDVAENGNLIVQLPDGTTRKLQSGEISIRV